MTNNYKLVGHVPTNSVIEESFSGEQTQWQKTQGVIKVCKESNKSQY